MELKINGNLPVHKDNKVVPPPQNTTFEQLDYNTANMQNQDCKLEKRLKDCFRIAFDFLDNHKHARTLDDFTAISRDMSACGGGMPDPLLKDLLVASFNELEREYIASRKD